MNARRLPKVVSGFSRSDMTSRGRAVSLATFFCEACPFRKQSGISAKAADYFAQATLGPFHL